MLFKFIICFIAGIGAVVFLFAILLCQKRLELLQKNF